MRKMDFCLCKTKVQISCAVTSQLIRAFVFTTQIMYNPFYYIYPKFQASGCFLSLHRPVCVEPGQKSRRPVFSCRGSYVIHDKGKISLFVVSGPKSVVA